MIIKGVDKKVTGKWNRANPRKVAEASKMQQLNDRRWKEEVDQAETQAHFEAYDEKENEDNGKYRILFEAEYKPPAGLVDISQNRTRLPKTAEACDRYMVSDRAGPAIASGALADWHHH